jgi:hypothetical protein
LDLVTHHLQDVRRGPADGLEQRDLLGESFGGVEGVVEGGYEGLAGAGDLDPGVLGYGYRLANGLLQAARVRRQFEKEPPNRNLSRSLSGR